MSVSNEQIYDLLTGIKGDVGEIKGTVAAHAKWMEAHALEDKAIAKDVSDIQLRLAKQAGAVRTWGLVAGGVAGTVGSLVGYFFHK